LAEHLRRYGKEVTEAASVSAAIDTALSITGKDGVICAFGSLYYVGEVREYFGLC